MGDRRAPAGLRLLQAGTAHRQDVGLLADRGRADRKAQPRGSAVRRLSSQTVSSRGMERSGPGWQPLLDAIGAEADPVRRANLELVAAHVVAEVDGDVDALLDTMVAEPTY